MLLNQRDDIVTIIRHSAASDGLLTLPLADSVAGASDRARFESLFQKCLGDRPAKNDSLPQSANGMRYLDTRYASDDSVDTEGRFHATGIRELLPEVVTKPTLPLYERFQLMKPPAQLYTYELKKMLGDSF